MRDVHHWTNPNVPGFSTENLKTGAISHAGNSTRTTYRSQRDDVSTTEPVAGRFYRPTDYGSYFCSISLRASEYTYWEQRQPYTIYRNWMTDPNHRNMYRVFWESTYQVYTPTLGGWDTEVVNSATLRPALPSFVIATARSRALARARSSDFNALQFIGELRETFTTLSGLIKVAAAFRRGLQNALRKYEADPWALQNPTLAALETAARKRRNANRDRVRDFNRHLDELDDITRGTARAYLTYIFGVMPLINDMYAVASALESWAPSAFKQVKVRFRDPDFGPSSLSTAKYSFEGKAEQGIEVGFTYGLQSPSMFQLWRFGLLNPAAALWELFPLSFIVDWFTGLGSFIQALDTHLAIDVMHGYETHYVDVSGTSSELLFAKTARNYLADGDGRKVSDIRVFSFWRYDNPLPPIPTVYVRANLNVGKLASLLALLTSFYYTSHGK